MIISFSNEISKLQPIRHKIVASLAPLRMSLPRPLEDIQDVSQFGTVSPF
jgi:hypothetical protein